ncbi:DUF3575 domain-containing protein [Tenacibaculum amylolyticum]|uniref:DUF3575 domain-containing protein n=1 Tax=Tenacibaculum amylolyticum TaxID=104269 RepID=UPI0038B44C48
MNNYLKTKLKKQNFKRHKGVLVHNILLLLFVFVSISTQSQEEKPKNQIKGDHEIKINGLYLIAGVLDLTYERVLNDESAIGISAAVGLDSEYYKFSAMPYYRFYFGEKRAAGFFIEGNGAILVDEFDREIVLFSNDDNTIGIGVDSNSGIKTRFGLGMGVGGKFLSKNGWIGELSLGFGRVFGVENDLFKVYGRFGITIGKRF